MPHGPSCPHGFPSEKVDRFIREHDDVIQGCAVERFFTAGIEAQRLFSNFETLFH